MGEIWIHSELDGGGAVAGGGQARFFIGWVNINY